MRFKQSNLAFFSLLGKIIFCKPNYECHYSVWSRKKWLLPNWYSSTNCLKEKWTNQCFKTVGNTDISKIVNEPPPLITCLVEDPKWTPLVIVKLPDPLHWPSKLFFEWYDVGHQQQQTQDGIVQMVMLYVLRLGHVHLIRDRLGGGQLIVQDLGKNAMHEYRLHFCVPKNQDRLHFHLEMEKEIFSKV